MIRKPADGLLQRLGHIALREPQFGDGFRAVHRPPLSRVLYSLQWHPWFPLEQDSFQQCAALAAAIAKPRGSLTLGRLLPVISSNVLSISRSVAFRSPRM